MCTASTYVLLFSSIGPLKPFCTNISFKLRFLLKENLGLTLVRLNALSNKGCLSGEERVQEGTVGTVQKHKEAEVGERIVEKETREDNQSGERGKRVAEEGEDEDRLVDTREGVHRHTKERSQEIVSRAWRLGDTNNIDIVEEEVRQSETKGKESTNNSIASRGTKKERSNRLVERTSERLWEEGGAKEKEREKVEGSRLLECTKQSTLEENNRIVEGVERDIRETLEGEEGHRKALSECSSIELIDRQMLRECIQQSRVKEWGVPVKGVEVSNIGGREKRVAGEVEVARVEDRHKEIGGKDNYTSNNKEYFNKGGEEEDSPMVEMQSESSSIDLVDRKMLDSCIQHKTVIEYREWREEEQVVDKTVDRVVRVGVAVENKRRGDVQLSYNDMGGQRSGETQGRGENQRIDRRTNGEIERELDNNRPREGIENKGEVEVSMGTRESISTTSSVAALFRDKHLEREGKKIGSKNITRRKLWVRWKGVVRGAIRRNIRRKNRLDKEVDKQREDMKLVFDYTTKGLSLDEVKLLEKGEAFCVVDYKIDEDRSKVDIYQFQRRLRLHEVFRDPGVREEEEMEGVSTPTGRGGNRTSRLDRVSVSNTQRRGGEVVPITQNRIRGVSTRSTAGRRVLDTRRGELQNVSRRGSIVLESQGIDRATTIDRRGGERGVITQRREVRDSSIRTRDRGSSAKERRGTQDDRLDMGNRQIDYRQDREGRRLPSIYNPNSHNRNLNRYNTCIQEEIMLALKDKKVKFRDNVSKQERVALKSLKQRIEKKEIIITRADKGSGLVALDYDKYIGKGTKYIEEEAGAYSKVIEIEQEIIGRLTKERNKIAEQLKDRGVIRVQTTTYIKKQLEDKITGIKFYYKIHKDRQIDTMPLRPLQSCIKVPMQHLSIVLTDILQPLLIDKNIPSFIFDSNQLLYMLHKLGKIPRNCTLISSDVSALYPSIPHVEGFRAMRSFLQEFTMFNTQQVGSIIRVLELVITENYMTWNSQIYKQSSGVAMGTPVAVAYANIFMHWLDREVRKKAPYIHKHIRYIDDNLFIVPEDKVEQLMEVANNILPPYIKFTYEKLEEGSGKGLPFLDTQLFIGVDYSIESRLYTKATDRHAYLLPSSYHPPHVTKNIPLAVFGRLRKICSREEWFAEDGQKAVGWLENRGYKKGDIQKAIAKVRHKDRWGMIEKIENNRETKMQNKEGVEIDIPLILTYNQHVRKIRKVLKDRQPLLDSAFRRTKVRPRLSFRRKRNLNDIIVQKGLRGPIEENRIELNRFTKCGEVVIYKDVNF